MAEYDPKKIILKIDGERISGITAMTAEKLENSQEMDEDIEGNPVILKNHSKKWQVTATIQQTSPDISKVSRLATTQTTIKAYYEDEGKILSSVTAFIQKAPNTQQVKGATEAPTSDFLVVMGGVTPTFK